MRKYNFKAALIIMFILTLDQMAMCNLEVVAHSDEHTKNYYPTAVSPVAMWNILASLIWFNSPKHYWLDILSSSCNFSQKRKTKEYKSWLNPLYITCLARNPRQTRKLASVCWGTVERLATLPLASTVTSPRKLIENKTKLKVKLGHKFVRWPRISLN